MMAIDVKSLSLATGVSIRISCIWDIHHRCYVLVSPIHRRIGLRYLRFLYGRSVDLYRCKRACFPSGDIRIDSQNKRSIVGDDSKCISSYAVYQ